MNTKNLLKGIILTIVSLAGGFFALSVPFRIFSTLSGDGVRILFVTEIVVYFAVGMIFLVVKDNKEQKKRKQKQQQLARQEKIDRVRDEWYNIAA